MSDFGDANLAQLKLELRVDEGVFGRPYDDMNDKELKGVGNVTIGVGRNLDANPLSAEEIDFLLSNDVKKAVSLLDKEAPWWEDLDDVRKRVLVNMCFNMGWGDGVAHGLSSLRTFLADLQEGAFQSAAASLKQTAWFREVGSRAVRLQKMVATGQTLKPYV